MQAYTQVAGVTFKVTVENERIVESTFVQPTPELVLTPIEKLPTRLSLKGTDFQVKVWQELCRIPRGETRTYSQIAAAIGKPNAYRAVANACGANNLGYFVPCHRAVGKHDLGGFKWGLEVKKKLLASEGVKV